MAPRLNDDEDVLATQLAPDFVSVDRTDAQYAEFNLDEVLRGAQETRVAANAQAIATGQMTPNEGRRLENRPDMPGGDRLLINAALIPLALDEKVSPGDGAEVEASPQKIKSVTAAAARELGGRLSRVEAVGDIDEDQLLAGVPAKAADVVRGLVRAAKQRGTDVRTLRRQISASVEHPLELASAVPEQADTAGIAEEVA